MSNDLLAHAEAAQKTADHLRRGTSGRADKASLDARAEADVHERKAKLLALAAERGVDADPTDEDAVGWAVLATFGLWPDSDCSEHSSDPLRVRSVAYRSARCFLEAKKAKERDDGE